MFGVPEAGHWVSRKMNLPVLYRRLEQRPLERCRQRHPRRLPGWLAGAARTTIPFTDLGPSLDFEMICEAAGGYGERVEDPAAGPAALERALHAVRVEKRQALLNIVGA